jgi:hypothetical protein
MYGTVHLANHLSRLVRSTSYYLITLLRPLKLVCDRLVIYYEDHDRGQISLLMPKGECWVHVVQRGSRNKPYSARPCSQRSIVRCRQSQNNLSADKKLEARSSTSLDSYHNLVLHLMALNQDRVLALKTWPMHKHKLTLATHICANSLCASTSLARMHSLEITVIRPGSGPISKSSSVSMGPSKFSSLTPIGHHVPNAIQRSYMKHDHHICFLNIFFRDSMSEFSWFRCRKIDVR